MLRKNHQRHMPTDMERVHISGNMAGRMRLLGRLAKLSCQSQQACSEIFTHCDSNFPHLQLIANDENLRDDTDQEYCDEALKFDKKVHFQEDKEPKHDNDSCSFLINDIPDHNRADHCNCGTEDSANKAEYRLPRSHRHPYGLCQVNRCSETVSTQRKRLRG